MDHNKMCDALSEEILSWAIARFQSKVKAEFVKNKTVMESKALLRVLQDALRQAADLGQVLHWKTFELKHSELSQEPH